MTSDDLSIKRKLHIKSKLKKKKEDGKQLIVVFD